jgi:hypothetical protein
MAQLLEYELFTKIKEGTTGQCAIRWRTVNRSAKNDGKQKWQRDTMHIERGPMKKRLLWVKDRKVSPHTFLEVFSSENRFRSVHWKYVIAIKVSCSTRLAEREELRTKLVNPRLKNGNWLRPS